MTTEIKERSITLPTWEVRAVLAGKKTQFRRAVIPQQTKPKVAPLTMAPWFIDGEQEVDDDGVPCWWGMHPDYPAGEKWFSCPWGKEGDRLWGREALYEKAGQWFYKADDAPVLLAPEHRAASVAWAHHKETEYCLSIHMPRWASRIVLEVKGVRLEQLQDISEADICAELGCPLEWPGPGPELYKRNLRGSFAALWDEMNKGYPWESNCWVWVISFDRR